MLDGCMDTVAMACFHVSDPCIFLMDHRQTAVKNARFYAMLDCCFSLYL